MSFSCESILYGLGVRCYIGLTYVASID